MLTMESDDSDISIGRSQRVTDDDTGSNDYMEECDWILVESKFSKRRREREKKKKRVSHTLSRI